MYEDKVVTQEKRTTPSAFSLPPRRIAYRTFGHRQGPITRLVSPGDLGEIIKPFVFLDLAEFQPGSRTPMETMWHPHSGIATVTVMLEGGVQIAETTGKTGLLPKGSVEYMRAGNGVWHTGQASADYVKVFQLWVALPPELENGPNASHYVMPADVPTEGPVQVILGKYGSATSPIELKGMNYLSVNLKDGERWTYEPPLGHDVAWVAVHEGVLHTPTAVSKGEIAVFEPSVQAIEFAAQGKTGFVVASAVKHPHKLSLGNYSVHTSAETLHRGEEEIRRIGRELRAKGTI
jgi:redox-sensitive bicupin YhaK (pirin superfamily)